MALDRRFKPSRHSLAALRASAFILGLAISFQGNGACVPQGKATGYRFPVVLNIPEEYWGYPVDKFEAWSSKSGVWSQIAIQIDEVNSEGSYVLENGLPFTKATDNGLADHNDEMSFLGTQMGELFQLAAVPVHLQRRLTGLRRLDICVGAGFLGSILVGRSDGTIAHYPWKELFDSRLKQVATSAYKYDFNKKMPMLVGSVFLKSGGHEYPVFENSTFFMPIVPSLWILPTSKFGESDFSSEIECWRSGPVRSIVAVGAKMKKFFSLIQLHLFSELIFYEDFFKIPTQIEMIFDANRFLDYGSGIAYVLRFPPGGDWSLSSNLQDLPTNSQLGGVEGRPKQTASQIAPDGVFRAWGSRREGSFLAQVRVDPKAAGLVPPPFLVRQNMFDQDPWKNEWPWLRGTYGNLGVFLDISRVRKGNYDFALDLMLSPRANDTFTDFRPVQWDWQNL